MFNINIILLNKNKRNCKLCKVSNFSRGFKVEATKLASDKPSYPMTEQNLGALLGTDTNSYRRFQETHYVLEVQNML